MYTFKLGDIVFYVSFTELIDSTFWLEATSKCGIKFNAILSADEKRHIQQAFAANKVTARYPCLQAKEDCEAIILMYPFADKTGAIRVRTKPLDYESWDILYELIEAKKEIQRLTNCVTQFQEKEAAIVNAELRKRSYQK